MQLSLKEMIWDISKLIQKNFLKQIREGFIWISLEKLLEDFPEDIFKGHIRNSENISLKVSLENSEILLHGFYEGISAKSMGKLSRKTFWFTQRFPTRIFHEETYLDYARNFSLIQSNRKKPKHKKNDMDCWKWYWLDWYSIA